MVKSEENMSRVFKMVVAEKGKLLKGIELLLNEAQLWKEDKSG